MNQQQIVEELLELLAQNGVQVRGEPLGGGSGGLCSVRGKKIFFLDSESATSETAARCAEALLAVVDIEQIYLRPQIREFVEKFSGTGA